MEFKQGDKVVVTDCVVEDAFNNMVRVKTPNNGCKTLEKEFVKHQQPKPTVSQAAMECYEENKGRSYDFEDWFNIEALRSDDKEVYKWLYDNDYKTNQQRELAFATLIVNGPEAVEVEAEKKYKVKMKNLNERFNYLNLSERGFTFDTASENNSRYKVVFTKQELEEAGFGGVFDNEMFEVEEVE